MRIRFRLGDDLLPVREIKTHSHEKVDRHARYCGIFNGGMKGQWPENRGYLELFAGPGRCFDTDAKVEVDGCPLVAAASAFSRLAFVEYDAELADSLEQRLRARGLGPERAQVFEGDANDPAVLDQALDFLPAPGLTFCFVDPEDLNSDWKAIEHLNGARNHPRYQRIDFLLNFPIGPMKRNYANDAKISKVLGTEEWKARVDAGEPLGVVFRETLELQFHRIGLDAARSKEIRGSQGTTVYDLVFASGSPTGLDFWEKIAAVEADGQRMLFPRADY